MRWHDGFTKGHDNWGDRLRNHADPFFAVSVVPFRETDAKIYTIYGKGVAFCCFWPASDLLPLECQSGFCKPRDAGGNINSGRDCIAFMEKADAAFHSGGHGVLYASGAACFLKDGIVFRLQDSIYYMYER